jgi:mRNA interferase RelE/StbE
VARYTVQFKRSAEKDLDALPAEVRGRAVAKTEALADDPRPNGCEKLAGVEDTYRVRVGDYRIVYEVQDAVVTVMIVKVGHRREVYR